MTDEEKALLVTATGIGESLLPELVSYIQKRMKAGSSDPSADFRLMLEAADAAYEEARAAKFGART